MKCNRLIFLVKNWYIKVQEEAMAPARMVAFMEKHISQCEECLADPDVKQEAEKIREIVLPPSKVPKQKVEKAAGVDVPDNPDDDDTDVEEDELETDEDEEEDDEEEDDEEDSDFDPDLMDEDDEI